MFIQPLINLISVCTEIFNHSSVSVFLIFVHRNSQRVRTVYERSPHEMEQRHFLFMLGDIFEILDISCKSTVWTYLTYLYRQRICYIITN